MKRLLLINPWIYDFAAYNQWFRPLGLLYIAAFLKQAGYQVTLVDCLERNEKEKPFGCGNYHKEEVEKPEVLRAIPRKYGRYGMPIDEFIQRLKAIEKPDAVLITTIMTYWYPGLAKVIEIIRDTYGQVPVVAGGIYITLNWEHATKVFGNETKLISGPGEHESIRYLDNLFGIKSNINNALDGVGNNGMPPYELYNNPQYASLLTSRGCPFKCAYCASRQLYNGFKMRDPEHVVAEIWHYVNNLNIRNLAFFDDALLYDPGKHFMPILDGIIHKKIHCNFHLPNGIFTREMTGEIAGKMRRAGFKTIRLSFESTNQQRLRESSDKVGRDDLQQALAHLYRAGYTRRDVGVYLLMAVPHQTVEEVVESLLFVWQAGGRPLLANYALIPGTPYYEDAKQELGMTGDPDPLLHNNSVYALWRDRYGWEVINQVKMLAKLVADAQDYHVNLLDQSLLGQSVRQALKKLTGL